MWFDTHCHLYDLEEREPAAAVLERAAAAGVEGIVVVGVEVATSKRAIQLAGEHEHVWAGAAFHPSEARGWQDPWAGEIAELLGGDKVVAVGETGIDLHWDTSYTHDQRRMFAAHIALAKEHNKALVVHTRDSIGMVLDMLEEAGAPERVIFHCWSGDLEHLDRALALGGYVSFAGNVSYKSADDLRAAAQAVPDDRLLVETDSPYLAPVPKRGRSNEPAYVIYVGEAVAAARRVSPESIGLLTTANARRAFAIS
ncbi:MAG: TatD family hydrolase [Actinomycetota bacterium]|nr:TatD family hydrolase [Actinomycetota bacterium]